MYVLKSQALSCSGGFCCICVCGVELSANIYTGQPGPSSGQGREQHCLQTKDQTVTLAACLTPEHHVRSCKICQFRCGAAAQLRRKAGTWSS